MTTSPRQGRPKQPAPKPGYYDETVEDRTIHNHRSLPSQAIRRCPCAGAVLLSVVQSKKRIRSQMVAVDGGVFRCSDAGVGRRQ